MTCLNQKTFPTLSEALAFRGALDATGILSWVPDYHMGSYWGGCWETSSGHRVVWVSDQDGAFSPEALIVTDEDASEEGAPETFMDVFRSARRFRAFAILLLLIAFDPIPRVHPDAIMDVFGQRLSEIVTEACIARSADDELEMLRCIYGDEYVDNSGGNPESFFYDEVYPR